MIDLAGSGSGLHGDLVGGDEEAFQSQSLHETSGTRTRSIVTMLNRVYAGVFLH